MGASSITCRIAAARARCGASARGTTRAGEPTQVTNLPLDVGSFRVSPKADRVFVTIDVYRDCATLACTKQRLDADTHSKQHGVLYDRIFMRHWDTWSDGRRSQLFSLALDAIGHCERDAGQSHRRDSTATCRRSPSATARTTR